MNTDRVILVNKPLEWTSFDVIKKLRYKLKIQKIGHAGTLDPLATGLLIVCTGKFTRKIDEFQAQEKEYTGRFIVGQSTPSHDLETEVNDTFDISHVTIDKIRDTARAFVGNIEQVPPMHSAIKVAGRRAYELARKGEVAELRKRPVTISAFDITAVDLPSVGFRIICSKGTYIRSLARDFGLALGGGAYLAELCRTRIGSFRLEDAQRIEDIVPE